MKFGVVVFPGSNCDHDCYYVIDKVLGQHVDYVWHGSTDVAGYDCLVLPGGFAYGDYLRTGAVARFSPVMKAVEKFADGGRHRHRDMQRIPDTARGRSSSGRDDAQHWPEVHLQVRRRQGRDNEHAMDKRGPCRPGAFDSDRS